MPIIKSAIKAMKQDKGRTARNRAVKNEMKTMVKMILDLVQKGDVEKAKKMLPKAMSAIDMAAKRNLLHKKNASHKKSRLQKVIVHGFKHPLPEAAKPAKKVKKAEAKTA